MNILHSTQLMTAFFAGACISNMDSNAAVGFGIATLIAFVASIIVHFNPVQ